MPFFLSGYRLFLLGLSILTPSVCPGGENVLAWVNTVDPIPKGHFQWKEFVTVDWPDSSTSRVVVRSGLEYGIAANTEAALYVNTSTEDDGFQSLSLQSKYMFLTPFTNPLGAAVFAQGDFGNDSSAIEGRLLLQKNFLDDTLIWAVDSGAHFQSFEDAQNQVQAIVSTGITYRFMRNWNAGFELVNRNNFGLTSGQSSTILAGPVLHYANQRCWITLSALLSCFDSHEGRLSGSADLSLRLISGLTF